MAMYKNSRDVFEFFIREGSPFVHLRAVARQVSSKPITNRADAMRIVRSYFTGKIADGRVSGYVDEAQYKELKEKSGTEYVKQILYDLANNYNTNLIAKMIGFPCLFIENNSKLKSAEDEIKKLQQKIKELEAVNIVQEKKLQIAMTNSEQLADSVNKWQDEYVLLKKDYEELKKELPVDTIVKFKDEEQVLQTLKLNAIRKGLVYGDNVLQSFHIAIRTSPLTILEGISGIGKSQLVALYAKTIGLDEKHLKILPVSPSWTDDTDILGYYDAEQHKYVEAETELVSMLLDAEQHPEEMYIVCFDEMNLAKIEHYFAKFLSLMEKEAGERDLVLFSENQKVENGYNHKIKIGNNVRFCGTINIDESTFRLSDKVLDRGVVITLTKPTLKGLMFLQKGAAKAALRSMNFEIIADYHMAANPAKKWLKQEENDALELLDELLVKADPRFGIAARVYKYFGSYLAEVPENIQAGDSQRKTAFDMLITQKIIPKIRGTKEQVGKIFGHIDEASQEIVDSSLLDCLKKIEQCDYFGNSNFNYSIQKIKEKARLLETYGYID